MEHNDNVPLPVRGYAQSLNSHYSSEETKQNYYRMLVATRDFCARIVHEYDEKQARLGKRKTK